MNLFCFSLEGSMDSLYEPVRNHPENEEASISQGRCSNPDALPNCALQPTSDSLESTGLSNPVTRARKKGKNSTRRPVSEGAALDSSVDYFLKDFGRSNERSGLLKEDEPRSVRWTQSEVKPSPEQSEELDSEGARAEEMGTLKRLQKMMRSKKGNSGEVGKQSTPPPATSQRPDPAVLDDKGLIPRAKSQESGCCREEWEMGQELDRDPDFISRPRGPGWYDTQECFSPWESKQHSCWRKHQESEMFRYDFFLPRESDWELYISSRTCRCQRFPRTVTDVDLSNIWRASSFGSFDRFRHQPHSIKPDEKVENTASEAEQVAEMSGEQNPPKSCHNGSGLGKTMRAISKTMKKKMARKYIKALSEEMYEGPEGEYSGQASEDHEAVEGAHGETQDLRPSESVESLYSLNSGQSSSSGVTSGSDAASNRDSLRLEEEAPTYTGPFCGRAKVHTDFTPSPYDTDSFKLKKGDIIDIISKPTMGTWTGMLNNRVGNFKFIYVNILPDEVTVPKKIRARRKSKRGKPTTLQELLGRIHLEDLHSTLLLNGYQTLDDFKHLKESHLTELNITDPDHRARLLLSADGLTAEDGEEEETHDPSESRPSNLKVDHPNLTECPRDSGCYITSENSDNGKDDMDSEHLPELVGSISFAVPSREEGLESS